MCWLPCTSKTGTPNRSCKRANVLQTRGDARREFVLPSWHPTLEAPKQPQDPHPRLHCRLNQKANPVGFRTKERRKHEPRRSADEIGVLRPRAHFHPHREAHWSSARRRPAHRTTFPSPGAAIAAAPMTPNRRARPPPSRQPPPATGWPSPGNCS